MSPAATENYRKLMQMAAELADLSSAEALLGWDQETKMPRKGIEGRAQVSATLAGVHHERLTRPEMGEALAALRGNGTALDDEARAQIEDLWWSYTRATKLPGDLVRRLAETRSRATAVWAEARAAKDFPRFAPHLKEIIALSREVAEAYGYEADVYDALLEEYEPGARTADTAVVLSEVKDFLVPFLRAIAESRKEIDLTPVLGPFDRAKQAAFGEQVVRAMGFDLDAGRIDTANHPFCSGIHPGDVRLATRYKDDIRVGLFGTIHEAGHGLYEQGVAAALGRTPLGSIRSLGIHESQSRLWENNVGLSLPFWKAFYPSLQATFPGPLADVPLDTFFAAVNDVRPSFIRIEADEVTYNLHVVVRFELEHELINGRLGVDDLPEAWNARYAEYLGITPPTPDVGVLQDIHWSSGLFGYFPTYTLGSLNAAQFYAAAARDIPSLESRIERGDLIPLKDWLVENVHRWGNRFKPEELVERATGHPTRADEFIAYMKAKYEPLYGLR
jgi:carboxypeptidase Taq